MPPLSSPRNHQGEVPDLSSFNDVGCFCPIGILFFEMHCGEIFLMCSKFVTNDGAGYEGPTNAILVLLKGERIVVQ
jgi:hypothetical protein